MPTTILIIEDDPSAARMMGYAFEHEGYAVLPAQNGLEGMKSARSKHPDIIILDVMLPGIDGFEVCNRLKTSPDTSEIPIIMISAKGQRTVSWFTLLAVYTRGCSTPLLDDPSSRSANSSSG